VTTRRIQPAAAGAFPPAELGDSWVSIRERFRRTWKGDASDLELEASLFVEQLRSLAKENPPAPSKSGKHSDALAQFATSLKKAAQYARRLDGISWLAIAEGRSREAAELFRNADGLLKFSRKVERAPSFLKQLKRESRSETIARQVLYTFSSFGLPTPDSENSFASECLREVLRNAKLEASTTEGSLRSLLRRVRSKAGPK